jgi:hypothetical protein
MVTILKHTIFRTPTERITGFLESALHLLVFPAEHDVSEHILLTNFGLCLQHWMVDKAQIYVYINKN